MTALEDGLEGSQIRGEKPPVSWSPVRWPQPVLVSGVIIVAPKALGGEEVPPSPLGQLVGSAPKV